MFWIFFAIFLVACMGAGATGGLFPPGSWYRALAKPSWTPPDWVFPVTWAVLYLSMSYAAALIASQPSPEAMLAIAFWAAQVAYNGLWTPVFFGLQKIKAGLVVLIMLWLMVAATLWSFWSVDTLAGLLIAPYLLWVSIAGALNIAVMRLNPNEA